MLISISKKLAIGIKAHGNTRVHVVQLRGWENRWRWSIPVKIWSL